MPTRRSRGDAAADTIGATVAMEAVVMDDAEAVERRLDAGEWLRTGDIAILFGVDPGTPHRWLVRGVKLASGERFRIRYRRTAGGQRHCNPADVRRLLDETRRERGGPAET
jgi:hypothetical protein